MIMDLINRLMNPGMGAQNRLAMPVGSPGPVTPGLPFPPAPQPPANPAPMPMAPAQDKPKPGPFDGLRNFRDSDRGQALADMFGGWAMGSNLNESLGYGARMMMAGRERRKGTANANQTVEWLMGQGMDEGQARAIAGNQPALSEFLKQRLGANDPAARLEEELRRAQIDNIRSQIDERNNPNARDQFGLNPIYGQDEQGNQVVLQPSKAGGLVQADIPDGVTLTPGVDRMDLGDAWAIVDRGGNVKGVIPKDLRGAEREKALGQYEGEVSATAPADVQAAQNAIDLIGSIRGDPNRGWGTGMSSVFNAIPGTPGYDFQTKVDQAKSGAFLSAIEQMRGLGALSNAEGQTATQAVTRMNTATSEPAFLEALSDYERIVKQGYERARKRLPEGAELPQPAQPGGGVVDYRDYFGAQ